MIQGRKKESVPRNYEGLVLKLFGEDWNSLTGELVS